MILPHVNRMYLLVSRQIKKLLLMKNRKVNRKEGKIGNQLGTLENLRLILNILFAGNRKKSK